MKKIMKFVAALAVVLTASCNKDIVTPEVKEEAKTVKVTMNATTTDEPDSKVNLNGTSFEWVEGDCIQLRWANSILGAYSDKSDSEKVYAMSSGRAATFEGEITYAEESIYAYYSNTGFFHSLDGIMYCHVCSKVNFPHFRLEKGTT